MKICHLLRNSAVFVFLALLLSPVAAGAAGITPAELDGMAVDPQSWKLQRDMVWDDYKPNPVIDWFNDLNPSSLNSSKFAWDGKPNRPIIGGLLMFQYLDRKFISSQPVGSDPLAYYAMNQEYASPDISGFTHNPVIDVYKYLADKEGLSRDAFVEKYTTGANVNPNNDGLTALDNMFAQWWEEFLNVPSEVNNYTSISEYWRENSYGKWDVDLRASGPYTIPYFEFEVMGGYDMNSGYQSSNDIPPSFRRGDSGRNSDYFSFDNVAHGIAFEKKLFDELDFFFLLHAGYDESGVWQEFGQAQFPTRQDTPYEIGPGPRMTQVEEFFTENAAEYLPIYIERYAEYDNTTFRVNYAAFTAFSAGRTDDIDAALDTIGKLRTDLTVIGAEASVTALGTADTALRTAGTLMANKAYDEASTEIDKALTAINGVKTALTGTILAPAVTDLENAASGISMAKAGLEQLTDDSGAYKFHLSQADWDWANGYNDLTTKNTRYVSYTAWQAAIGEWSHAVSTVDVEYADPVTGEPKTRTLRRSTQGENDAMATFAHEFCHISIVADNYGNAWTNAFSPYTEPWDIVSRGSFGGPYGDHARWMVPGVEAGTVPTSLMQYLKNIHMEYNDEGDVLEVEVENLAENTPVVASIVPRNIPLGDDTFYPNLKAYGLEKGIYYKSLKLDFGKNASGDWDLTGEWADKNENTTGNRGFKNTSPKKATNIYVEVVDQSGYDSFAHDYGVLLSRAYDSPRRTYTGGSSPSHQIIDSHIYDIAMIDYTLGDSMEDYAAYPIAHAAQLADSTFKAGISYTDTGYYMTQYNRGQSGNPVIKTRPDNADLSAANWHLSPVSWEINKPGSIARNEDRDGRDIASGETVNEYYDAANNIHIYILRKNLSDGRQINGETQQYLSYQVGVLHDDGRPVQGSLKLTPGAFSPADGGNYARQTFELVNDGAVSTDIVRITLSGNLAEGRTQEIQVITGQTEPVTHIVPKPFSEQNAVILNNLYAVEPGKTVSFDVFVKADGVALEEFPFGDLVVTVSSESNADNVADFDVPDAPADVFASLAAENSQQVRVSFTAPGGEDILYYNIMSGDIIVASRDSSPVTVTGLTVGRTYRFAVTAVSALGESPISALSNPVTPTNDTADNGDIAAAKIAIESAVYGPVKQADVSDSAAAKGIAQNVINGLDLSGVTAVIVDAGFAPAVAGTAANPSGTAGFYSFNVTLSKGTGTSVMTNPKSLSITATPYEEPVPPRPSEAYIGGQVINLYGDASGTGWTWNAASDTLSLTGGNVGEIAFDTASDVHISVTADTTADGIFMMYSGRLIVEGADGKTLSVNVSEGSAVAAEADVIIESGVLTADTTDTAAAAIESKYGSVSVTGDADVTATANGGSAIRGARDVTIGTTGTVTAKTTGAGYALSAGNAVAITGGTVNITAADESRAYNVTPTVSDEAVVTITPVDGEPGGGGGCNAGCALLAFAAFIPFVTGKRK